MYRLPIYIKYKYNKYTVCLNASILETDFSTNPFLEAFLLCFVVEKGKKIIKRTLPLSNNSLRFSLSTRGFDGLLKRLATVRDDMQYFTPVTTQLQSVMAWCLYGSEIAMNKCRCMFSASNRPSPFAPCYDC